MAVYLNRKNRLAIRVIPALVTAGIIGLCGVMPVGAEGLSNNTRIANKDEQVTGQFFPVTGSEESASMEASHNSLTLYDQEKNSAASGVYVTLINKDDGALSITDNSMEVGTKEGNTSQYTSIFGVYGAPSFASGMGQVTMSRNSLTVNNSNVGDHVIGVYDITDNSNSKDYSSLTAENNKLTISKSTIGETIHIHLYSPNSNSKNSISENTASITDSSVNGSYFGTYQRYSKSGDLKLIGNSSDFTKTTVYGHLFGSNIYDSGNAVSEGNTISLSGSSVAGYLFQDDIYGAKGNLENNKVTLSGSSVKSAIYGEAFSSTANGAEVTAKRNSVILSDSSTAGAVTTVTFDRGGGGTFSKAEAIANKVQLQGGSTALFAAAVQGEGDASDNTVHITDSTVGIVAGAIAGGNVTGNSVTIGGTAKVDYTTAEELLKEKGITNAAMFLPDSSWEGNSAVIAGYSTGSGSADNNAVNITGQADLEKADLYGYLGEKGSGNVLRIGYDGSQDAVWKNPSDNKVKSVSNFDTIELHQGTWGKTMLHVADAMDLSHTKVDISHLSFENGAPAQPNSETVLIDDNTTFYDKAKIDDGNGGNGISFAYSLGNSASALLSGSFIGKGTTDNGNIVLKTGNVDVDTVDFNNVEWGKTPLTLDSGVTYNFSDAKINTSHITFQSIASLKEGINTMTLMDTNSSKVIALRNSSLSGEILPYTVGTTLEGNGKAYLDNGNLQYSISLTDKTRPHAQPQTHMTVMGQEAGLTALVDGSDLVIRDLSTIKENEERFYGFASVMGGENRYDTGSYLRTNMWNGHAGVGWKSPRSDGSLAEYALFYDYGDGNYRTYDAGRRGHGKINYKGAGVFGRYRLENRTFVEGSFRTGRLDNEARHVLYDGNGKGYDYDTNSRYNAFHVGFGRTYDRGSSNTLELYGRYFYTHINGDDYEAGGHYHLDSADSSLLRIGGRWNHRSSLMQYYAGAAYEYEFDGKAAGLADGAPIRNADIRGSSVRFELGAKYTKGPWVLDFGGHGYAGKHRGVGGNINIAYRFF